MKKKVKILIPYINLSFPSVLSVALQVIRIPCAGTPEIKKKDDPNLGGGGKWWGEGGVGKGKEGIKLPESR